MSNTKHAEWVALKYTDCKTWTVAAEASIASKIATEAHARLIAASPELLEALSALLDAADVWRDVFENEVGCGADDIETIKRARAAIAKATGDQP